MFTLANLSQKVCIFGKTKQKKKQTNKEKQNKTTVFVSAFLVKSLLFNQFWHYGKTQTWIPLLLLWWTPYNNSGDTLEDGTKGGLICHIPTFHGSFCLYYSHISQLLFLSCKTEILVSNMVLLFLLRKKSVLNIIDFYVFMSKILWKQLPLLNPMDNYFLCYRLSEYMLPDKTPFSRIPQILNVRTTWDYYFIICWLCFV